MRLSDVIGTTTFRWTLAAFAAFVLAVLLSIALIFARASVNEGDRVASVLTDEADVLIHASPEHRVQLLEERLRQDPRRVKPAAIFSADGKRLVGNIESSPQDLRPGDAPAYVPIVRIDGAVREQQTVIAIRRKLPNDQYLVIGWSVELEQAVIDTLRKGAFFALLPASLLGLAMALFFSMRVQKRIAEVNTQVQRIIGGELRERLPARGTNDPFDKLAQIVNGMLDEIETLVHRLAGVGDDIAHDLRTPLTSVRIALERGRANAISLEELQSVVEKSISGVDRAIAIITALLRIREIEHSRKAENFTDVDLAPLLREVGELYEPFAEEKRIFVGIEAKTGVRVRGDRDLLFEAIANLVDNAIKFTPEDGRVEIALTKSGPGSVIRVSDTGPGITAAERDLVGQRFYRSDKSRHTHGVGLGLSLVMAITKFHEFRFSINHGSGFVAEITMPSASASD